MKILVTGANGFVGKNLVQALKAVKDGKDTRHVFCNQPSELEIFEYDIHSSEEELKSYCRQADFVFHLAGVNRTSDPNDFRKGNFDFSARLLELLKQYGNCVPVMLSSSIQASLEGRFAGSEYGRSKLAGEELFRRYGQETGANVFLYRFPNLFGKWCRPNYNSVVSTFCYNIARHLEITVNDPNTELELLYIDDVLEELFSVLKQKENRKEDGFCYAEPTHRVTLGELASMLYSFRENRENNTIPNLAKGSFSEKLYATYLSFLPSEQFAVPLTMKCDERGSFTEILRTGNAGQVSVNISKPGAVKGQHWHHSKSEKFIVVKGKGLIRMRKIGLDADGKPYPVIEYPVNGEKMTAVDMIPGYTHQIINLSEQEELITVMWASECFDPNHPDTYFEEV